MPRAARSLEAGGRAGQRCPGGGADAAYWSRSRSPALADHGSSSAVEQQPVGVELVPEAGAVGGRAHPVEERLGGTTVEERSGRCGCRPRRLARRSPRSGSSRPSSSRQTSTTAREPMCFSSHTTLVDADRAVGRERLVGVLEQVRRAARSPREPWSAAGRAASAGRSANRLITSSAAAAFSSRTVTRPWWRGLDDPLAEHVGDVEQVAVALVRRRRLSVRGRERLHRLVPDLLGGDRDDSFSG